MLQLWMTIFHASRPSRNAQFIQSEVVMGSAEFCDLVLPGDDVDARHARLVVRDGRFILIDLKSATGTMVNDRKIRSPQVLKRDDTVRLGDYRIVIEPSTFKQAGLRSRGEKVSPARHRTGDPWTQAAYRFGSADERARWVEDRLDALLGDG